MTNQAHKIEQRSVHKTFLVCLINYQIIRFTVGFNIRILYIDQPSDASTLHYNLFYLATR